MITNIYPYLVMNGNGQEAVKFYENALGANVVSLQTFGDMPGNSDKPESVKNLVLNAQLKAGDFNLMLSDTFPGNPYQVGDQVSIAVLFDNPETTKEVYEKLKEGGKVIMELQPTFWSPSYGQLTDKFGVTWQLSTDTAK
ncbi:VOC family protein [Neobacillus terrae]|uniref:VOC family protein n=1 Tax=Neobacillus terrae TaxID=3034837 RepID=UPI00140DC88E|nr:VOC family protein [Neobacillus terrae]NHM32408.1 VOC family protein [Neobacillus terrae]